MKIITTSKFIAKVMIFFYVANFFITYYHENYHDGQNFYHLKLAIGCMTDNCKNGQNTRGGAAMSGYFLNPDCKFWLQIREPKHEILTTKKQNIMVSTQPEVNMNGRYSVNATCELLGIHRNTLLKYTKLGYIRCGFRATSKRKFYYGREIVRFWLAE